MAALRKPMSAERIEGARVVSAHGENLGEIADDVLDIADARWAEPIDKYYGSKASRYAESPADRACADAPGGQPSRSISSGRLIVTSRSFTRPSASE